MSETYHFKTVLEAKKFCDRHWEIETVWTQQKGSPGIADNVYSGSNITAAYERLKEDPGVVLWVIPPTDGYWWTIRRVMADNTMIYNKKKQRAMMIFENAHDVPNGYQFMLSLNGDTKATTKYKYRVTLEPKAGQDGFTFSEVTDYTDTEQLRHVCKKLRETLRIASVDAKLESGPVELTARMF